MPQKQFRTQSGIHLKGVYAEQDLKHWDKKKKLGTPGEFPFTRGIYPNMYQGRLWTMRLFSGFASAQETNKRFHYLLKQGQTGLSVAFDFPTLIGYNSDHPSSKGEVGKTGVAVNSLDDMETLFRGIPLDQVSTSMTINGPANVMLSFYFALAQKRKIPLATLRGTIQNDILKEYFAQNTYIYPPEPSVRLIMDMFEFCATEAPKWNMISISGYHIREAGATAVQELAFTLANGIAYVEAAQKRGLNIDTIAPRLSFFFDCHNDFFEEIAKFRAARRIWAHLMRDRFKAKNKKSWLLRFHTQTAGVSLTAQQPQNNVTRVALQAMAAVLGGTQSLHTNSLDEALALPTEESARLALRTQQILAYETGVTDAVDPVGGAYFIEKLTDQMEAAALKYIRKIEQIGGVIAAIENNYLKNEIAKSSYQYEQEVDSGERKIVGVNCFKQESVQVPLHKISPKVEREQKQRLQQLYKRRSAKKVEKALSRLRKAAEGKENTFPFLLEAAHARATLGEICDIFRSVFGVQEEQPIL
jgi:methylmalonyl-CoA mutase N-terminal domain/subunit